MFEGPDLNFCSSKGKISHLHGCVRYELLTYVSINQSVNQSQKSLLLCNRAFDVTERSQFKMKVHENSMMIAS